jgi:predicted phosphodiesterase
MRIAVTADLHWDHNRQGDEATRSLVSLLRAQPPDLVLLGGDQGTEEHFGECLELFRELACPKALVPGNHDIWVADDDARGDSLDLYQKHLPGLCAQHGFHYLDHAPLVLPDADLAVIGSINWYDYSWSLERLRSEVPGWERHVREKTFTRGRHNDARFVRWRLDDIAFTRQVVAALAQHLDAALERVSKAIVLTHHPALYGLNFPRAAPPQGLDSLLWDAFAGNASLEAVLRRRLDSLAGIFSGHTHRERTGRLEQVPAFNVGGDYGFKRLLLLDWPAGTMEAHTFGDAGR